MKHTKELAQPEALRLADIQSREWPNPCPKEREQAAAELRRLHEVNAEMARAMEMIKHSISQALITGNDWRRELRLIDNIVDLAIAKAGGAA